MNSYGGWNFIGYVKEVSTVCWGNDQTFLSARGPNEDDNRVKLSIRNMELYCCKMPEFLPVGILDLLRNISLLGMILRR